MVEQMTHRDFLRRGGGKSEVEGMEIVVHFYDPSFNLLKKQYSREVFSYRAKVVPGVEAVRHCCFSVGQSDRGLINWSPRPCQQHRSGKPAEIVIGIDYYASFGHDGLDILNGILGPCSNREYKPRNNGDDHRKKWESIHMLLTPCSHNPSASIRYLRALRVMPLDRNFSNAELLKHA